MTEVRVTSPTGAAKGSKLCRPDLIPAEALMIVAEHYGKGAAKYTRHAEDGTIIEKGDHNWRKGYDWSLSLAALQRHTLQFAAGENYDRETGSPHMAAVVFHALALITYMTEHPEFDDRPSTLKERGTL